MLLEMFLLPCLVASSDADYCLISLLLPVALLQAAVLQPYLHTCFKSTSARVRSHLTCYDSGRSNLPLLLAVVDKLG
jgi:hypothetical protein